MIKICELCGDEFVPKQKTQKYCSKPHYKECPICKESFFLKKNRETKTCSVKCASTYRKKNVKYENTCLMCDKKFVTHTKHTMYCDDVHYDKCKVCSNEFEIKDNHRPAITCSESCASTLSHTKEARENRRLKSLERHGTEFPLQSQKVVDKIRISLDNSENDMRIGSQRWNQMLQDKYNVENISQVEEIKRRKEITYFERYGVYNPAAMQISNYKDWNNLNNFVRNMNYDCLDLANYFNTSIESIRYKVYQTNSVKHIKDFYTYSNPELIVKHILTDLGLEETTDFIPHVRNIISPLELDFYIPKLKLAIEVSPTYTHNSKQGWGGYGEGLDRNYHMNKLSLCNKSNIELITIFDWHDIAQVKNILYYKINDNLNLTDYCYRETDELTEELKHFLNIKDNTFKHGKYVFSIIEKEKDIVSAFIWLENKNKVLLKKHKCIIDERQSLNIVIREYSKRLKSIGINSLIVMSDLSFEFDKTYEELNFKPIKIIEPRINYHNIRKNLFIKSNKLIKNNANKLELSGFLPVYDCGHKKWRLIL